MIFISIAAPQDPKNHQEEERERRRAGGIYKHCGTARPIKPSGGREREKRELVIFISIAAPQDP